ncbi:MAG: MlaD family protein [Brevinematia bacterium]
MYKFSVLEKTIGFLIVFSLILLFVLLLLSGRANDWFRGRVSYYTILNIASDVSPGKKIYYKGIVIGKIDRVVLLEDDRFKVFFNVYVEYTNKIRSDSIFLARSELLGGKKFEIIPGSETAEFTKQGEMVYSIDTYEGKILAKLKGYYSPEEDINRIINNVSLITSFVLNYVSDSGELTKTLKNLNVILTNVNSSIEKINMYTLPSVNNLLDNKLARLVDNLIIVLDSLEKVLKDENISKILKNANRITEDISEITEDLKKNKGNINGLINNLERLSRNLNDIAISLKSIVK